MTQEQFGTDESPEDTLEAEQYQVNVLAQAALKREAQAFLLDLADTVADIVHEASPLSQDIAAHLECESVAELTTRIHHFCDILGET